MKTELPTVAEMQLIESRVANDKKSVGVAYGLWFFLGLWGIHNFYLGKTKTALFQLLGGAAAIVLLLEWRVAPEPRLVARSFGAGCVGIELLLRHVPHSREGQA